MTVLGASHALYVKDVQTKALIAAMEARASDTMRLRDIEAAHRATEVIRQERLSILMLGSAFASGAVLFFLIL